MTWDVQLRQFEYLVALSREQHFGRAAQTCFVTQPALSAGIRRLEAELGLRIVQRGQRFAGFTPEGQRVVGWAHRILAEREGLKADLERIRGGLSSTLRLGSIPTTSPVAAKISARFRAVHPDAAVSVSTLSSKDVTRQLSDFTIDAGLTYLGDDFVHGVREVRAIELYKERYHLITPAGSALADQSEVHWGQLGDVPLCALNSSMKNRRLIESILAAHSVVLRPVMETDNVGALFAYVASAKVSCVVSETWVSILGVPDGTDVRPLAQTYSAPTIGLVLPRSGSASMVAEALAETVQETSDGFASTSLSP